jgi:uncharacterized protein (TIGR02284 family)
MTEKDKVLRALHDLVATCNDASEGYAKAAKGVHNQDLGNWLAQASADRDRFSDELSDAIRKAGGEPGRDLHEGGILHQGWVDLEQRLRSTDRNVHSKADPEIVRECLAGDSGSLPHYDHALEFDYDPDTRALLLAQRTAISDDLLYLEQRLQ